MRTSVLNRFGLMFLVLLASACERSNSTVRLGSYVLKPKSSLSVVYSACNTSWTDLVVSDEPDVCGTYQASICAEQPVRRPPGSFMVVRVNGSGPGSFPIRGSALADSVWGLPASHCTGSDPGPGQSSASFGTSEPYFSDFASSGTVTLEQANGDQPVYGRYELAASSGTRYVATCSARRARA